MSSSSTETKLDSRVSDLNSGSSLFSPRLREELKESPLLDLVSFVKQSKAYFRYAQRLSDDRIGILVTDLSVPSSWSMFCLGDKEIIKWLFECVMCS